MLIRNTKTILHTLHLVLHLIRGLLVSLLEIIVPVHQAVRLVIYLQITYPVYLVV
uniref:Uncharacterized protein n=1 Tax=Myoviridae sp. ct0jJ30 TaxID=2825014 RepID=A0A8S5PHG8_9CAUD|nr:MAG TPA: hypothetical protein [Myoviridae sp. ct0jJ30]